MKQLINRIYKNNAIIYKALLFLLSVFSIVYFFPKGGQFKYDFNKGKPWQYDNLYATFNFSVRKSNKEVALEKQELTINKNHYFEYNITSVANTKENFTNKINSMQTDNSISTDEFTKLVSIGNFIINRVYKTGFLEDYSSDRIFDKDKIVYIRKSNEVEGVAYSRLFFSKDVSKIITDNIGYKPYTYGQNRLLNILSEILKPNVSYDIAFTQKYLEESFKNISYTKGLVETGELIIIKGDIVEGRKLAILNSLKIESESKVWTESNYNWVVFGYTILVSLAFLMLLLFLQSIDHKFI